MRWRSSLMLGALIIGGTGIARAAVRYVDPQLAENCTSGNYSVASRACTGSDGDAYRTINGAVGPTQAGDTISIRGGVYAEQIGLHHKTGTANAWITVTGHPGEAVTLRFAETSLQPGYGPIRVRGNRGYFVFENLILDGSASVDGSRSGWAIRDGNHHFVLRNLEFKNFKNVSAILVKADDIVIQNCRFTRLVRVNQTTQIRLAF